MGVTPQGKGITINFDCQFEVHLKGSTLSSILAAFAELLPQLLTDFFQKVHNPKAAWDRAEEEDPC